MVLESPFDNDPNTPQYCRHVLHVDWMQTETGYRVEVITVRKLEYETDPFSFSEKVGRRVEGYRAERGRQHVATPGLSVCIGGRAKLPC
jgi:hypothetical protein